MKKSIITLSICFIAAFTFAQTPAKQDTTIQITMTINQFRGLMAAIDQSIDSKKLSKEIITFLQESAKVVQPADKPKKQ